MRLAIWIILSFVLLSCSTATTRAPVTDDNGFIHSFDGHRCQSLLDQRDALSWGIAFASGLTAAGGVTTAGIDTGNETKDKNMRWGFGIGTAVLGAAASSMMVLVRLKSSEFETYCNQPLPSETKPVVPSMEEISVETEDGGVE